jgi:hypothetical protein
MASIAYIKFFAVLIIMGAESTMKKIAFMEIYANMRRNYRC